MSAYERESTTLIESGQRHAETVSLRVDDEGLSIDGKLAISRAEIASVSLGLEQRTTVIVRATSGRRVAFPFTSADDANALVTALGRTRDNAVLEVGLEASILRPGFHLLAWWWLTILVPLILVAAFLSGGVRISPGISGTGRKLEIGADGLRISWFVLDDFIPWSAIASVSTRGDAIVLALRDGRETTFTLETASRVPEIVARITASIDSASSATVDDQIAGLLGSDVAALRELGREHDGAYRAAHVPRERLLSLVEDPTVPPVTRARAAVALSSQASPEDKQRIRIAADASVNPKVRIAIQAAAGEDDVDALERKLAELEDQSSAASVRPRLRMPQS